MKNYYFDYAATTPLAPAVIDSINEIMQNVYGNPSSIHGFGREAKNKLEKARAEIAHHLKVKPSEVIFNSGGTEGNNTAIFQVAKFRKAYGKHIITTAIEHHSVSFPIKYLQENEGFEVTVLSVDEKGQISIEELKKSLREDTILVSMMAVNNEIGNLLPIHEVGEILNKHQAIFHVDAVQALAYYDIFPKKSAIDLLSFSAHKINGPRGVGFLFIDEKMNIPSFLLGGDQEEKRRAGTENLPGIVGMATAFSIHSSPKKEIERTQLQAYKCFVLQKFTENDLLFSVNGSENASPHILNLHFPNVFNQVLLMRLDLEGFAVSNGSACTAGSVEDSDVLVAMFEKENPRVRESIRISFGMQTTKAEVELLTEKIVEIVKKLQ